MSSYEIVQMNKDNAIEYAKVNTLAWCQSYIGIIDQEFLDDINTKIDKTKDNLIKGLNDDNKKFLLKVNDKYVGIFKVGKSKYPDYEDYGEVGVLYLLNEVKKQGYGKILFERAKEELVKMGYHKLIVGCLESNYSNDFYKYMGCQFKKKVKVTIGKQQLNENVYIIEHI